MTGFWYFSSVSSFTILDELNCSIDLAVFFFFFSVYPTKEQIKHKVLQRQAYTQTGKEKSVKLSESPNLGTRALFKVFFRFKGKNLVELDRRNPSSAIIHFFLSTTKFESEKLKRSEV